MNWMLRAILLYAVPYLASFVVIIYYKIFSICMFFSYWDFIKFMNIDDMAISLFFISFAFPFAQISCEVVDRFSIWLTHAFFVFPVALYFTPDYSHYTNMACEMNQDTNSLIIPIMWAMFAFINDFIVKEHNYNVKQIEREAIKPFIKDTK